jgi:hypothetical protein
MHSPLVTHAALLEVAGTIKGTVLDRDGTVRDSFEYAAP